MPSRFGRHPRPEPQQTPPPRGNQRCRLDKSRPISAALVAQPKLIEDHMAALAARGVGPASRRKVLMVLSGVFRAAVRWREVPLNPIRDLDKPPATPERHPPRFSPLLVERLRQELRPLAGRASTDPVAIGAVLSLLAYAGLRPGEALCLTFRDLGRRVLHIDKAVRTTEQGGTVGPTKTKRKRSVPLVAPLAEDLAALRAQRGSPADGDLLFPNDAGQLWDKRDWDRWRAYAWRPAVACLANEDSNLEWLRSASPYALRGSFVSLQLRGGASPLEVADWAGHSAAVMFRHYAGVIEDLVGEPTVPAEEQIRRARELVRSTPADEVRALTAESVKPSREVPPSAAALLYGPRRRKRRES